MRNIEIKGARVHNLKNIDVTIPRNSLTVITGLSGSGKSSLAFDTLYSECQRRYVESLSAYARQFLGLMEKPDVDQIDGLSPAISIEQKTTSHNPRSTVGTVTEIHDYLRLLYARVGTPTCYECGRVIARQSVQEITDRILALDEGTKFQILAPVVSNRKGSHKELIAKLQKSGYVRIRVNGVIYSIDDDIPMDKNKKHNIEVVVDRLVNSKTIASRLAESLETALSISAAETVIADIPAKKEEMLFSQRLACPVCGISCDAPTPAMFSFNSPQGACEECHGLGFLMEVDPDLVAPDQSETISGGAIIPWNGAYIDGGWNNQMLNAVCKRYRIPMDVPYKSLSAHHKNILLHGTGDEKIEVVFDGKDGKSHARFNRVFEGVIPNLLRRYKDTASEDIRRWIESFMSQKNCPSCLGTRYRKQVLAILVDKKNIAEISKMSIESALEFFQNYSPKGHAKEISKPIIREILQRLGFLNDVGLSYLTLSRTASTLSGGESQRIRLATQIGSRLTGVLYILDEPSIGLHPRDNARLLATLTALRDLDNTVVVIEHDMETIMAADYLIDIGPGAGTHGGEVVACGKPSAVAKSAKSLTGRYMSGKRSIPIPKKRRPGSGAAIKISGAAGNNLKSVDVSFPLGMLVCVTGVSGSGKSSLVNQTLYPSLQKKLYNSKVTALPHKSISGLSHLDKVIDIDQSPFFF
ncbi:MAG: excinuclease ABC subunit UvrA, partial [Chitinispirillales bacterium]|nr:excinuclease ABC subunit UvrA [Chitinispirillales bacterium]